jgi:Domain of unknown function (DUF4893)
MKTFLVLICSLALACAAGGAQEENKSKKPAPKKKQAQPSQHTVTAVASVSVSPSPSEETLEWRQRIGPQHVESVESAEALAVTFNSARLAAGPRGAGKRDDTKDLSTAIELLKPQDRPFKEKDLLGKWRCRSIQASDLGVIVYPFFNCRFIRKDGKLFFEKTTGSQRRSGYLYPSAGDHMVFLGSLTMNDDVNSGEYTDTVGVLVRKAGDRFLLIIDATKEGYELYEIVK